MFAKKNLVAAAALLALAGAAHADVKLYGMLDLGFGSFEDVHAKGDQARTTQVASGKMMTSYFGLAGSEDLGGGLKAEFALESFLAPDTGANVANNAGQFWGRGSNIALSGGFGKVALGQYDNPLFTSAYTYNPFGSSMGFSPTMRHLNYVGGVSGITGAGAGFDTGWINSVTYESPVMSGFSAVVQYAAKETKAVNAKDSYAASGTYANGPLAATLTYVKAGYTNANGTVAPATATSAAIPSYNANDKITDLGASYDFGVVKAFGQYTYIKKSGDASSGTYGAVDMKDKIFQLGVSVPVTDKAAVMVSFGQLKHTVAGVDGSTKDEQFSLGYDYTLSKRTDVYGVFSNVRRTELVSGQTFAVGIKHNF
jgi:predicted porin